MARTSRLLPASHRRPLQVRATVLALGILVVVVVMARAESGPSRPGESLMPVDTHAVLMASVLTMIGVESLVRTRRRVPFDANDTVNSMSIGLGYLAIGIVGGKLVTFGAYVWLFEHVRLFTWSWRSPMAWVAYWIIGEFVTYWVHRAEHRSRFLWASHQVHHSSTDLSFTTAVRMPWTSLAYKPLTGMWAPLLGFPPIMYPVMGAFVLMVGQLQHTTLIGRLGPLDRFLMTPSNHRVHHASNPRYLDRNFGGHTVIFDRLFGTHEAESVDESPVYGLTHPVAADGPLGLVAGGHPELGSDLRSTPGARAKLALCLGPPRS